MAWVKKTYIDQNYRGMSKLWWATLIGLVRILITASVGGEECADKS
jgi:hypothetical protein